MFFTTINSKLNWNSINPESKLDLDRVMALTIIYLLVNKNLIEKPVEYNKPLTLIFIDYEKTFQHHRSREYVNSTNRMLH